ncbi:hypothetical protein [Rhodococcus sp. 14-2470-1b]|uniref:hypothetical protein n=1 Tax=Rhodococcus sp. 14-2470-1b TaxID=2023149 RepID=UPI0015957A2C|nr:hypothetical protein [Rhodococcus sp. 14-2470-1b]
MEPKGESGVEFSPPRYCTTAHISARTELGIVASLPTEPRDAEELFAALDQELT